ncbi:unnamed protein product [Somion occarium]|uniref:mitogen-activated protein kinase n=1 Tax=Somion occarium TaxID=3059160 RepID=A0ABP1E3U0_9APHY
MVQPETNAEVQETSSQTAIAKSNPQENVRDRGKSTSPVASPGSSEGKRGRSRTRGTPSTSILSEYKPDRQGYHSLMSSFGKVFHVEKRWKLIREMGSGAYGYVISAVDEISGEPVAIKMVTRVFEKVQLAKRALREITLLRHFSHENITGLIDVDCSPNLEEIYIFMEPMEADLHQIIKSGQKLSNEHVQYFVYQILRGLKYIHSASVVHRDLKPGNLLVNADCELKICDFGLSRGFDISYDSPTMMTEYVATRWYRAPEIMLAFRGYSTSIDMWSVGCILAELLLGKPLFKGKDYVDQLNKILDILGTPPEDVIKRVGSEKAQVYIRSLPRKRPASFKKLLPNADIQALDLLQQLIAFDPAVRLNAVQALEHPWLSSYHEEEDEPVCHRKFDRWKDLEMIETLEQYRESLLNEIQECRREVRSASSHRDLSPPRSPSMGVQPIAEEEGEEDHLTPMPFPTRGRASRSPGKPQSPDSVTKESQDQAVAEAIAEAQASSILPETDPVVAYARRSSMFVPSRTNSSYSVHRVPPPPSAEVPGNTVVFPSAGREYVVPGRTRTASTFGYGAGGYPSEDRRRLLRTLSTVSIYESGEGHAGGLADIAPIGKYIVENHRTGDDDVASGIPMELEEVDEHAVEEEEEGSLDDAGDRKRRFTIE